MYPFIFLPEAPKPLFFDFKQKTNKKEHHTDDYKLEQLIVRRGQSFNFSVVFQRELEKECDTVTLKLAFGKYYVIGKTMYVCLLTVIW